MIKIIADSSADKLYYKGENCEYFEAPLTITAGDNHFVDNKDLDVEKFAEFFKSYKGRSMTACPSVDSWIECFGGSNEILVFTLTSGISGTYNSALVAKNEYLQTNPDAKIEVIDTLSTGAELRFLVEKAISLAEQGCDFESIVQTMKEATKRTRLFFSLKSLHNFAQNGRVSKLTAQISSVLGIRVFGTASKEGTLKPIAKCLSDKIVLKHLIQEFYNSGFKGGKVFIAHLNNEKFVQMVQKAIAENFENVDITVYQTRGLCSYYVEDGGVLIGFEGEEIYK